MNWKKLCALLLTTAMTVGTMAACGKTTESGTTEKDGTSDETADTEEASGSVKILMGVAGGKDEAEMELFVDAMEEATGLTIEVEKPASDYSQVMMQKLSGGEKYDLIYLGASEYSNLVEQEALMDITEYVKNSEILSNNIEQSEWDDITIDGKIYGGFNKKELHRVVALNNTLLKKAGIDYKSIEPTMDGYYEVFKQMKEVSEVQDFYPFDVVMKDAWDMQPWMAAEGLKTGVQLDESGKKYVPVSTDAAAPVWEWFKKLFDEGLMDPSAFVDGTSDMRDKMGASSQKIGCSVDWAAWVGLHNGNAQSEGVTTEEYEVVSLPGLQTPDGSYMLAKGGASLYGVPANAENVEGAVKVLEYFATQEGGELLSIGIEGNDYTKDGDTYTQTETGKAHANDHGAPVPIYKDFEAPMGYNPGMEEALEYGEYASIEMTIANEADYKEIVGKWGIQIIKGEVSTEEGLASMRAELKERGVTEV
ncbi:MAG: extracellular solute-binding protein [Clostridiales bacterium]|nr:extracellular solute-binding protein [Clostridiales bacterium]